MKWDDANGNLYLAYYDSSNSELKFAYNTDPSTSPSAGDWTTRGTAIDSAAGMHVKMAIDPNGGIHLAYYDNVYGNLKYAYLPSYNCLDAEIEVVTVDALFTNGMYNCINIKDFDDTAGTDYRPIISSYSLALGETNYSVRVGYPTTTLANIDNGGNPSTGEYTGNWEVITACASTVPSQDNTFIETDSTTQYNGQILVGYSGGYIEEATLLDE